MEGVIEFVVLINSLQPETQELWYMLRVHVTHLNCFVFILMAKHWYILSRYLFSVGAKCQILSSVAPPRKKNLVTIFNQGHVLGPWKPMFY